MYMYIHVRVQVNAKCIYTRYMYVRTYIHVYQVHVCTYVRIYMYYVDVRTCMYVHIYIVHVHVRTCMCI